jgi:2-succinyl-5-enolpyruvyl-6-hydroxy-3-cyclohexene-1-carboxylate synthase
VNPSTAFATVFADELARCGIREAVIAPGSRSTPMAMAFHALDVAGRLRLHVRIDERAASFTALGIAKASRRPVAILCTSGTAAANFHPAVIEASESGIPLLVLTADRPPELRGTGASQTIDQVKMYGDAVRWYADPGAPERRAGAVGHWRSLACQAAAQAAGTAGTFPGPVHVNLPFRDPLVPDGPVPGGPATGPRVAGSQVMDAAGVGEEWPESLEGRPGGAPWTRFASQAPLPSQLPRAGGEPAPPGRPADAGAGNVALAWAERGLVVCGDGDYDAAPLLALAERAGWPVLAEPSSSARRGPNALTAYQYLLASAEFMAAHRPEVIISAGRPGLSRPQTALLRSPGARHVVIVQGPGHWADQARHATDVAGSVELTGVPATVPPGWLGDWRRAGEAAREAADAILDAGDLLTEPRLARDLLRMIPEGSLLWVGSSMPVRDVDFTMPPRDDIRILSSRGASGIDGTTSSAIGAALAHDGPAFAVLGDLTFVHDAAGLAIGPGEPRPDLCLIVVNNDGGGIFNTLEQAAFLDSFERLFGTRHGTDLQQLAGSFGIPYTRADTPEDLAKALAGTGLRVLEVRTSRDDSTALRAAIRSAAVQATVASLPSARRQPAGATRPGPTAAPACCGLARPRYSRRGN